MPCSHVRHIGVVLATYKSAKLQVGTERSHAVQLKRNVKTTLLSLSTCLLFNSFGAAQTTQLLGDSFAYHSTGDSLKANTWTLDRNGYVGTYITLAAPGNVTVKVQAEGTASGGI